MKVKIIGPEEIVKPAKEERKKSDEAKTEEKKNVKKEKVASKPSEDNFWTGSFRVILSIILAVGAYFTARHFLPQSLSSFWLEFASLIISLLVLKAISIAYGGRDNKVGSAVFVLMLAIFAWQLIDAYADYEPPVREQKSRKSQQVTILYPKSTPYVSNLKEVGDETGWFTFPYSDPSFRGVTFTYNIFNEGDNNVKISFSGGNSYISNGDTRLPSKAEPIINVIALRPNQEVELTVGRK